MAPASRRARPGSAPGRCRGGLRDEGGENARERVDRQRVDLGVVDRPPQPGPEQSRAVLLYQVAPRAVAEHGGAVDEHDALEVDAGGGEMPVAVPVRQNLGLGAYLVRQKLAGREKFPLIVELEPLFACDLACLGCGKIQYPAHILKQRMSVQTAITAVEECGAPMVWIAGGKPLIHSEAASG